MRCATVLAIAGVVLGANAVPCAPVPASGPAARDSWAGPGAWPGCAVPAPVAAQSRTTVPSGPTFRAVLESGGNGLVTGQAGDLHFRKRVYAGGRFALHLTRGADVVDVVAQADRIEVTRQGRTVILALGQASEDDYLDLGSLVAGSAAVASFRAVASTLGPAAGRTPGGLAVRLSGVLLAAITGDEGAVERFVVGLPRPRGPARIGAVPAAARRVLAAASAEPGCYEKWESEVMRAWDDYWSCLDSFSEWNPVRQACALRYLVWAESAWFSFLSCAMLEAAP